MKKISLDNGNSFNELSSLNWQDKKIILDNFNLIVTLMEKEIVNYVSGCYCVPSRLQFLEFYLKNAKSDLVFVGIPE